MTVCNRNGLLRTKEFYAHLLSDSTLTALVLGPNPPHSVGAGAIRLHVWSLHAFQQDSDIVLSHV